MKKFLGLVASLAVVFLLAGVGRVRAQSACQMTGCFCQVDDARNNGTCNQTCVGKNNGDPCASCVGNAACGGQYGCAAGFCSNGHCDTTGNNCGVPFATSTPTPPVVITARVQGRYRLMPSTVDNPQGSSIAENYYDSVFGQTLNLKVYLDNLIQGNDFVTPYDITNGENPDSGSTYASAPTDSLGNPIVWNLFAPPTDTWTARIRVPNGYSVGYTLCYNNINCHNVAVGQPVPNIGNSVALNEQAMFNTRNTSNNSAYADLYWHICRNQSPTGLNVGPELLCGETGSQRVSWNLVPGTLRYAIRIDDNGTFTGDTNGDGRCDNQTNPNPAGGDDDWCADNIPPIPSGSQVTFVLPNGFLPNKKYTIKVHAINQCGGGQSIKTEVSYERSCPLPTITPNPVSCQNMTAWKGTTQLVEPLNGKIALNDVVRYRVTVHSNRAIALIRFALNKGAGAADEYFDIPTLCGPAGSNTYNADLSVLHDIAGSYRVRYVSSAAGFCGAGGQ